MKEMTLTYKDGNTSCEGFAVFDDKSTTKRPAVLVAHAWRGQDDFARNQAKKLAEEGYFAFAIDMFGDKKNSTNNQESAHLIAPFISDRFLLRQRVLAAFDVIVNHPLVDSNNIGAIGFCFGGLTVLELLLSGANIKAVVAFHGVYSEKDAKLSPIAKDIKGSILLLHGFLDPMTTQEEMLALQNKLSHAKIDWQLHMYGEASHAFTNPIAQDPSLGLIYNEKIARLSFNEMNSYLKGSLVK